MKHSKKSVEYTDGTVLRLEGGRQNMTPEGEEKAKIKAHLAVLGAYQFWPVQTGYGSATIDCMSCLHGDFIAIEAKKQGYAWNDFTGRQRMIIRQFIAAGALVVVGTAAEVITGIERWESNAHKAFPDGNMTGDY